MTVNVNMTRLAIQGYVDRAKAEGHHPSEPFAIPLALEEWEALLKFDQPKELERELALANARIDYLCSPDSSHSPEGRDISGLLRAADDAEAKLRFMARTFMSTNFTDRYGDGPVMLDIADKLKAELKRCSPMNIGASK